MVEAHTLSKNCGQAFVVITADQQIYTVIVGLHQISSATYIHDWEDIACMREDVGGHFTQHKKESKACIQADSSDRLKI